MSRAQEIAERDSVNSEVLTPEYDYIIVGAGSAGCALAGRLAERRGSTGTRILVLEAGPADTDPNIRVPAAFPATFKTEVDWDYSSTPQAGLGGERFYMPRGRVYGGSSSINAMIYMRGNPATFDMWAKVNPGWSWEEVLPLFKRAESNERGASDAHGADGPLSVSDHVETNPLTLAMADAAHERGYPRNDDFNDGHQEGFGPFQVTQQAGMRCSAATAYLHPAIAAGTLTVVGQALVHRVVIEDGRAVGVVVEHEGHLRTVTATAEIILAGGAFNTPQLLMLSGIGPRAELASHGIETVVELPGVGQNLQEHYMLPVAYECTQPVTLAHAGEPEQAALLAEGKGMLTSNIGEGGGFVSLEPTALVPELQFHFAPTWFIKDGTITSDGEGFSMLPSLVQPRSRGTVTLASADPHEKVVVDPAVFDVESDIDVLVKGIEIARDIMTAPAMDHYRGKEVLPGPEVQTVEERKEYIRKYVQTIYHPVGTCKMGTDPMAVVDPQLRVHGIAGLRVADASVMPAATNANTNAVCIMIGEKCADLITGA